jgi:hypothetical protein
VCRLNAANKQMLARRTGIIDEVMLLPARKLSVCAAVQRKALAAVQQQRT